MSRTEHRTSTLIAESNTELYFFQKKLSRTEHRTLLFQEKLSRTEH